MVFSYREEPASLWRLIRQLSAFQTARNWGSKCQELESNCSCYGDEEHLAIHPTTFWMPHSLVPRMDPVTGRVIKVLVVT